MDETSSIEGSLPPFAGFPPATIRESLALPEWQACLDTWIFCVEYRLRLLPEHFKQIRLSDTASGLPFLLSYFQQWTSSFSQQSPNRPQERKEVELRRLCLLLSRRLLLETAIPYSCPPLELFAFLANGSATFGTVEVWKDTLHQVWNRANTQILDAINASKALLIKTMSLEKGAELSSALQHVHSTTMLTRSLAEAGPLYLTGSDYLDVMSTAYARLKGLKVAPQLELGKELTANVYVCFRALMKCTPPRVNALLDNLYGLQAASPQGPHTVPTSPTLLSSLLCSTPFLRRLGVFLSNTKQARGDILLRSLQQYKTQTTHLHHQPPRRRGKVRKGKAKATNGSDMHIHLVSQVSQIHELFPDLSTSYILRLLDHFSDDVERVTAALLEPASLPSNLQEQSLKEAATDLHEQSTDIMPPRATPPLPAQRRNVFDGDDFDNLRISPTKIHIGRKEKALLEQPNADDHAKSKAAIMAALAAFDSDDDERDDSYDVADVGGTVDTTLDDDIQTRPPRQSSKAQNDQHEETLFRAWKNAPDLFARHSKTRLSQPRQQLKRDTGMTDEQIEGWAVMLSRNQSDVGRLDKKYSTVASLGGQQRALAGTKWQSAGSGTATEEDDSEAETIHPGEPSQREQVRGGKSRGSPLARGINRGRGGSSTAGLSSDPGTQNARRRKEQGRGRGGPNHNRREGRVRKMAKGFAGALS